MALPDPLSREIFTFGNDPTLPKRATAAAESVYDLRRGLAEIASQGGYASRLSTQEAGQKRRLEGIKGLNTRINTALGNNLDYNNPNFLTNMAENRAIDLAAKVADMEVAAGKVGRFSLPPPDATMGQALSLLHPYYMADPSSVATALAGNEALTLQAADKQIDVGAGIRPAPGAYGGIERYTITEQESGKATRKTGLPQQGKREVTNQAQKLRIIRAFAAAGLKVHENSIFEDEKGTYVIDSDGNEHFKAHGKSVKESLK